MGGGGAWEVGLEYLGSGVRAPSEVGIEYLGMVPIGDAATGTVSPIIADALVVNFRFKDFRFKARFRAGWQQSFALSSV